MSASGKVILWTGGGAVLGAVARFLIAGVWTRAEVLRHVGFAVFTASAVAVGIHWFEMLRSATEVTLAAVSAGSLPLVARAVLIAMTGKVSAKVGGVEIADDGK